ncbi:hypothetical protein AB7M47_003185 [Bradyrhizobium elkanii]
MVCGSSADVASSDSSTFGRVASARGDADALFLAAGQFGRIAIVLVGNADELEQLGHTDGDVSLGPAEDLERQRDIVRRRPRRQQVEVLEDHADRALRQAELAAGKRRDLAVIDDDAAARRLLKPVDEADEARFAGAGAADHAGDRAARDREVDRLQGVHARLVAIGRIDLRDRLEADHGFARVRSERNGRQRRNMLRRRQGLMYIHSVGPIGKWLRSPGAARAQ